MKPPVGPGLFVKCEYKDCGHILPDHTVHGFGPFNLIGGACSKCNCPGYMQNGSIAMGG